MEEDPSGVLVSVDLTGATVKFSMFAEDGTAIVNEANATIITAAQGKVSYSFSGVDVDAAGTYYGYFIVISATKRATYPAVEKDLAIVIYSN